MPSPSSPLEYRPTPHLILIIIFILLPLVYLCGRLAVRSCCILLFVLKSMFSPILQLLYGNELIPISQIRYASPLQIIASTTQETQEVEQSSDEQLTDECDGERGLISAAKITDHFIKAQPGSPTDAKSVQSHLEIQTGLHDSEHDSGNDEDHSALSASSTATTPTIQVLNTPEVESMQNHNTCREEVQWRHRDAFVMNDV